MERFDPNNPDHLDETKYRIVKEGDVYYHVMEAVKANKAKSKVVNWAVLLHDVGKVPAYTCDEDGNTHFYKHECYSDELIDGIAKRLTMDNELRDAIKFAANNHMLMHVFPNLKQSVAMKLMNDKNWDVLLNTGYCDAKSRGLIFSQEDWEKVESRVESLREWFNGKQATENIRKVINGGLIMKLRPEVTPSKEMGRIIKETMDWIVDNGVDIEDMELIEDYIRLV
tara:strand:+ start:43450 stop:44127 length:678 start_codon:yes stop_codon:yes gene_type:complete